MTVKTTQNVLVNKANEIKAKNQQTQNSGRERFTARSDKASTSSQPNQVEQPKQEEKQEEKEEENTESEDEVIKVNEKKD